MKKIHAFPLLLAASTQYANAAVTSNADAANMVQGTESVKIDVLANDTTTSEGGMFVVRINLVAAYGSAVINEDNTVTYTPNESFVGVDTFSYVAADDSGYGGDTLVTVEVKARTEEPDPVEPTDPERPVFDIENYVTGARNKSVASMLGVACNAQQVSERLANSCDQLSSQANEQGNLDDAVSRIAPDEALIQRRLMAENSRNKTSRLYQSVAQLRTTSGPAAISINNKVLPTGGGAGDGFSSPWTLLTSVQSEHFERKQTDKEAGYESSNLGALLGFGYRVNSDLNLGLALDWSSYEVDFADKGGNLDSDIRSLTGFLSYYKGAFHADVQAGYTSGDTQAKRIFDFPETAVAESDYGSSQWNVSTQLEWAWQPGAWGVRPFLRLDYLSTNVDAFTETGSSIWNTSAGKQTHKLLNSSLGLDTSYTLTKSWGVIIPGIKLSAINQSNLSNDAVNFQLVDANSLGNFQLRADSADSMFYEWTFSTAIVLPNGVSTFISARSVSSYNDSSARQITAGINWEF
jgi:uncharacterized protein YhjY with autotransporter beta-barrel domain